MSEGLPIEPGSDLDQALSVLADIGIGDCWTEEGWLQHHEDAVRLVDPRDPVHMLALGTRLLHRKAGVTDPLTLVAPLYDQWYGKPCPAVRPSER